MSRHVQTHRNPRYCDRSFGKVLVTHPSTVRARAAGLGPLASKYPITPDHRYFVVNERLWRMSDPTLPPRRRQQLVDQLMSCRRRLRGNTRNNSELRAQLNSLKRELGERGPVWWTDGTPDYNRHKVDNTPYRDWYRRKKRAGHRPS